ncbi:MAG: formate dehydrogenase accessory sulfurtransferase FdhD, partial [Gammaproteobacteria bacterium]
MRDKIRSASVAVPVSRQGMSESDSQMDLVAIEEPLEIRLEYSDGAERTQQTIAITMRTPGDDIELALGFLFAEGIVSKAADCTGAFFQDDGGDDTVPVSHKPSNRLLLELHPEVAVDLDRLERHFYT